MSEKVLLNRALPRFASLLITFTFSAGAPTWGSPQQGDLFADLERPLPLLANEEFVHSAALADLDGDGAAELCLIREERLTLYLNDGNGVFSAVPLFNEIAGAQHVIAFDATGDGVDDFLVILDNGMILFPSEDAQPSWERIAVPPDSILSETPSSADAGDFDGDGDSDLLVSWLVAPNISSILFENLGDGLAFRPTEGLPKVFQVSPRTTFFDQHGDGDLDIAVLSRSLQNMVVLTNGGHGSFRLDAHNTFSFPTLVSHQLQDLDLDGNGIGDLFVGASGALGEPIGRLFLGQKDGSFTDHSSSLPLNGNFFSSVGEVVFEDLDGDGDVDLILNKVGLPSNLDPRFVFYLENDGLGNLTDRTLEALGREWSPGTTLAGDLDRDGDFDLFQTDGKPTAVSVPDIYWNDGTAVFTGAYDRFGFQTAYAGHTIALDADGDGFPEFLSTPGPIATTFAQFPRMLEPDGAGRFVDAPSHLVGAGPAAEAVAADFDADGDVDLLTGFFTQMLVNDGEGTLVLDAARLVGTSNTLVNLFAADLDLDGDIDGVGRTFFTGTAEFLVNDGTGTLISSPGTVPLAAGLELMCPIDVDGDGLLDLLILENQSTIDPEDFALWRNLGAFQFQQDDSLLNVFADGESNLGKTAAFGVGDFNADGWQDVYLGLGDNSDTGLEDRLWLNDGSGRLVDASSSLPTLLGDTKGIHVGDVDEDGDLDCVLIKGTGGASLTGDVGERVTTLFNDGSANFSTTATDTVSGSLTDGTLVDIDRDGDLDLVADGRILSNLTRQLAWQATPRLGKPLDLQLWGPESGPYVLFVSEGPAAVDLGPIGFLQVDLAAPVDVVLGSFDASGRATKRYSVPADPALAGVRLYSQAIAREPGSSGTSRLTNLEVIEFAAL